MIRIPEAENTAQKMQQALLGGYAENLDDHILPIASDSI